MFVGDALPDTDLFLPGSVQREGLVKGAAILHCQCFSVDGLIPNCFWKAAEKWLALV
jgi:hypothetical protein